MMEAFLGLLFFVALLVAGASLECESCYSTGHTCNGSMQTCAPGQDTCHVGYAEHTYTGKLVHNAMKGCTSLGVCNSTDIYLEFGKGKTYRARFSCCSGDECQRVSPRLTTPPSDPTSKGIECSSCFSFEGLETCSSEKVKCSQSDYYCLYLASLMDSDGTQEETFIKGCTSLSVCELVKSGRSPILGSELLKAKCVLGTSGWEAQSTRLLQPAFSGLLLMTMVL